MKPEIHPKYEETIFKCACGEQIVALSTLGGQQRLDICSSCHPFYTGKEKLIDTAGRIEKFKRRYANVSPNNA